jgi:hypothetical protein
VKAVEGAVANVAVVRRVANVAVVRRVANVAVVRHVAAGVAAGWPGLDVRGVDQRAS